MCGGGVWAQRVSVCVCVHVCVCVCVNVCVCVCLCVCVPEADLPRPFRRLSELSPPFFLVTRATPSFCYYCQSQLRSEPDPINSDGTWYGGRLSGLHFPLIFLIFFVYFRAPGMEADLPRPHSRLFRLWKDR